MASVMQRIIIVTDAWEPQVNGVVTTLKSLVSEMQQRGVVVEVIEPSLYKVIPLPSYPEIPLVWSAPGLEKRILEFKPDAVYIATEGGLGWKARNICVKHKLNFSTGYHTKYPEYVRARYPIPESWTYALLKLFHRPAQATLVPSVSLKKELETMGFKHLFHMTRGFNKTIFNPQQKIELDFPKPICLYVGRVATEKNLQAFLDLSLPGSKVVIGNGPALEELKQAYPNAYFLGKKFGNELASYYASADVFVFPSLTDTFGVVNIEAMACGTPVAAFPVTGPKDSVKNGINGFLSEDLKQAVEACLEMDTSQIESTLYPYSWQAATDSFLACLSPKN